MKESYKIEYHNTNVRKLWNLVKNKVFDRRMVYDILSNAENSDYIYFKSKRSYLIFKRNEFSALAMYDQNGE